jgi:hypothetical protein
MTRAVAFASTVVFTLFLLTGVSAGHHGDAGRYEDTLTTVSGTVVEVQIINPHSVLMIAVTDDSGQSTIWRGELGPPRALRGWCWGEDVIASGDQITMRGRRLKNGQPYMTLSEEARVIDANGREIFRGNEPGEPDEPGPCAE